MKLPKFIDVPADSENARRKNKIKIGRYSVNKILDVSRVSYPKN